MSLSPADAAHRERTLAAHHAGARRLGCSVSRKGQWGWGDRSVSTTGEIDGEPVWVRTVGEDPQWITDGSFWTGNLDANTIIGVPKPTVLAGTEDRSGDRWFRTEVMTLVSEPISASDPAPTKAPDISPDWFSQLRGSLDRLAAVPTDRVAHAQEGVTRRLHRHFGNRIDATVERWVTAHNDLHWANLTAPNLTILDWEGWGIAPAGYDAATLYCHSLLIPETARWVHEQFTDVLDTSDGLRSQFLAAARILDRAERGEYVELLAPLSDELREMLKRQAGGTERQ